MNRPLIGVNLLYVRPGYLGGTVRYAHELLRHLVRSEKYRWKLYVQARGFQIDDPALAQLPRKEFRIVGGLAGRVLVEHLVLPQVAQRDGVAMLFSPGFVSPLWGRFKKVVTIHDLYYKRFPSFVRFWQRQYWRVFVPMSLRMTDIAVVDSDSTFRDVSTAFRNSAHKVRRVYLGADSLSCANSVRKPSARFFCLVVGNITPNKNIETVVAALSICRSRDRDIGLVVAGNDLFGLLASALRDTSPTPTVDVRKQIDDASLAELYLEASCLIQASHYEGFGLPAAEAMMMGCPVIASDIPVLHEVCGEAASYFRPESATELADTIERLMDDPDLQERGATKGREHAERFRWGKAAEETSRLFDTLL